MCNRGVSENKLKTVNSSSEHVNYMEGILCDLELGKEL